MELLLWLLSTLLVLEPAILAANVVDVFGYGLISLAVYLWAFPRPPFSYRERDALRSRKLIVAFTIFAVVLCTGSNISLAPPLRLISVLASFAILVGAFIDIVRTSLRPRR